MVLIRFRKAEDAQRLYTVLICRKIPACAVEFTQSPENMIRIQSDKVSCIHRWFVPAFTSFILSQIEGRWMREMIQEMFYFTDEQEQEQILAIAHSMLDGKKEDGVYKQHFETVSRRVQMIETALKDFLTPHVSFSFESFLHFRLKDYRDSLYTTVEMAIDEYKLEQEYQAFVEQLRSYILSAYPLFDELHVVEGDKYEVYQSPMEELERKFLMSIIDTSIWEMDEFDASSSILAPIVSAAPSMLYYYTDDLESGITQTLMNVFQEKVKVFPKAVWKSKKESQIQS